jgi:hypothetical protein
MSPAQPRRTTTRAALLRGAAICWRLDAETRILGLDVLDCVGVPVSDAHDCRRP